MGEMQRLADLRDALYPPHGPGDELRARVLTATATEARPAGRAQWAARPRWALASLAAAGILAVAAGATLLGGLDSGGRMGPPDGGPPAAFQPVAFTVRVNADGSVTFTARDLVDADAATQALNNTGIAGKVLNETQGCTSGPGHDGQLDPTDFFPADTLHGTYPKIDQGDTVILRASDYPSGGGLLVVVGSAARPKSETGESVGLGVWAYADVGRIPACVNFTDAGTGG